MNWQWKRVWNCAIAVSIIIGLLVVNLKYRDALLVSGRGCLGNDRPNWGNDANWEKRKIEK